MKRLCVFAHWDRDNIIDDFGKTYFQYSKRPFL